MYKEISEAVKKHPDVDILVNFASLRSAYDATIEALNLNHVCSHIYTFSWRVERAYLVVTTVRFLFVTCTGWALYIL